SKIEAFAAVGGPNISKRKMETRAEKTRRSSSRRRSEIKFLLFAAMVLHASVTFAVLMVGRYQFFPSLIYPTGVAKSDGIIYQSQIVELDNILKREGVRTWATLPGQLHVRLYALPFSVVSPWVSFNILTVEPLNLV